MATYMSVSEFADREGISVRKARRALEQCHAGKPWRGHYLDVRLAPARGGPGGKRYEVSEASLPAIESNTALVAEVMAPRPEPNASSDPQGFRPVWAIRHEFIRPALDTKANTKDRGAVIRGLLKTPMHTPAGPVYVKARTLRAWIAGYEKSGAVALRRKPRSDHRSPRVMISRAWDAYEIPADARTEIVKALSKFVRSLWAGPDAFSGWKVVAQDASIELRRLTAEALGIPPSAVPKQVCAVTRNFVERDRAEYQELGTRERDRKRFDDIALPRIRRSTAGMKPMEIVMGDVHPLDIYYRRDDGSAATPKLIAFLDRATGRIRVQVEFFEKGHGVCEEHVIRAFKAMSRDLSWGLATKLYIDNGSEYKWNRFVNDAMTLNGMTIYLDNKEKSWIGRGTIIARPYNAAAKGPIEGAFHQLESRIFCRLSGWIGGDRSRAKSANVGKAPAVYPGSKEELVRDIQNAVRVYNDTPQDQGELKGLSPNARFAQLVEGGWGRTDIDEPSLFAAFCARESRTVRQGAIQHNGRRFYHDRLVEVPAGAQVTIGIPKWGEKDRLAIWDERGNFLCVAAVDQPFDHNETDAAGAKESQRRAKVKREAMAARKRETVPIDGRERLAIQAELASVPPAPGRAALVSLSDDQTAAGKILALPARTVEQHETQVISDFQVHQRTVLRKLAGAGG